MSTDPVLREELRAKFVLFAGSHERHLRDELVG
ncbi:MAG: hypothetical protein QOF81_3407, partial [Acidimicrobiaceae bacterium]|nr:hypothetical protein [Acidimicrobiaceae bacterium]